MGGERGGGASGGISGMRLKLIAMVHFRIEF